MPAQRPSTDLPGRLHGLLGLWLTVLLTGAFFVAHTPEAAAASSKTKKKTSKKKKKAKPRPAARKPVVVTPLSRFVEGPTSVTSGGYLEEEEVEGDADEEADDTDGADALSELDAIEKELLSRPPDPEPAHIELPPVVSDPKPIDRKPGWVKHQVIPGETVAEIAERYGVDEPDIIRWNRLDKKKPKLPFPGKTVRVMTSDAPLPRERVEHVAKRGETYESIAKDYGVDADKLRRWNKKAGKGVESKEKLVVWREQPPIPALSGNGLVAKLAQIRVPSGGISIGRPSRGRLVRGVELPERPDLYVRRKPDESYGSTHAISQLMAAIVRFRHETGFKRSIVIGGISRARGGRFRPHKSHQSGRDMDIRMPLTAAAEGKRHVTANDIDWKATWQLMHAFIQNGEVEYIFLDYSLQKRIYKAAREAGVPKEQLTQWVQWPVRKPKHHTIRHVEGHKVHFHVRVRCADHEKNCVTSR